MADDKTAQAEKELEPYHSKLAEKYGPEFKRSQAYVSIRRWVAEGRSAYDVIRDLGSPI